MRHTKKHYEDDDGRIIASMSDLNPHINSKEEMLAHSCKESPSQMFSKRDRRIYALAALKAALLIGLAFLAGLAFVIWLITLL